MLYENTIDIGKHFREDKVGCTCASTIASSKFDASKLGVCNMEFGVVNVFCTSTIDVNRRNWEDNALLSSIIDVNIHD